MDGPDDILQQARRGDHAAVIAYLEGCGVDSVVTRNIAGLLRRGRGRDAAIFEARVAARMHYVRGRSFSIPRRQLLDEMVDRFGVPRNVAEHLAESRGYAEEREETERRLSAEADNSHI